VEGCPEDGEPAEAAPAGIVGLGECGW